MRCRSGVAQAEFAMERKPRKENEMLLSALNHGFGLCQSFHFSSAGALAEMITYVLDEWGFRRCIGLYSRLDTIAGGGWRFQDGMVGMVCRYGMAHGWRRVVDGSATEDQILGMLGDAR
jgi:hypothetical protein